MLDGIRKGLFIPFNWDIYKGSSLYFDIFFRLQLKMSRVYSICCIFLKSVELHISPFLRKVLEASLIASNFDIQPHQVNNMRL